ncbi:hypothetical protein CcCBS67573_g03124 [Chytriomyces confervae]|uniref:Alpha-1,3-mannosyltransferase n=1 Tax=Chytriomyces confervae TaxID=246404 RepID=A0A507FH47_9FUNG|nr:hypothetical protein CcCBS67573_g03124 [Chytriomyces confervae]
MHAHSTQPHAPTPDILHRHPSSSPAPDKPPMPTNASTAKTRTSSLSHRALASLLAAVLLLELFLWLGNITVSDSRPTADAAPSAPIPAVHAGSVLDAAHAQLLDYLSGETRAETSSPFGGSLKDDPTFSPSVAWLSVLQHAQYCTINALNRSDFVDLSQRARSFHVLHRVLFDTLPEEAANLYTGTADANSISSIYKYLQEELFPWLSPDYSGISEMLDSFQNNNRTPLGIAITGGSKHIHMITHLIQSLRTEFNISLPVEVFYAGEGDMHPGHVEQLNLLTNVKAINLLQFFPSETQHWETYSAKPFALLAASFRTVLFMDADVLFFKDPRSVLETQLFQKNGQYFFHDRFFREGRWTHGVEWFLRMNPVLTQYAQGIGYVSSAQVGSTRETHEMDSGFVVMDKGRTGVLLALLLTCTMNSNVERKVLYHNTFGDKESFWMSSEILRVPYEFNPYFGGTLGQIDATQAGKGKKVVCGERLLQVDHGGDLFWWNGGGVLEDRSKTVDFEFRSFDAAVVDKDGEGTEWVWYGRGMCQKALEARVLPLSENQVRLLKRYQDIYEHEIRILK